MSDYFPGRDYPDRDEWLRRRAAQRDQPRETVIYRGKGPFMVGLNHAKREASVLAIVVGESPNPKDCRQSIVRQRHNYWLKRT